MNNDLKTDLIEKGLEVLSVEQTRENVYKVTAPKFSFKKIWREGDSYEDHLSKTIQIYAETQKYFNEQDLELRLSKLETIVFMESREIMETRPLTHEEAEEEYLRREALKKELEEEEKMFKILKYATPSCTICRIIQPRLENIAKKNNAELKVIMVGSNNDLEITSVPTIKIQVGENTYDVCSGGNPNVILKTVEDKIAELHKQKVF